MVPACRAEAKNSIEVFAEYRNFCESFSEFCLLLLVRALSQFGISADVGEAGSRIAPGTTVRLSSADLRLAVVSSGAIQLCAKERVLMSFVPLPTAINRARSDDELEEWLRGICSDLHGVAASSHTIVLYLSSVAGASKTRSPRANGRVRTIGNEPNIERLFRGDRFGRSPNRSNSCTARQTLRKYLCSSTRFHDSTTLGILTGIKQYTGIPNIDYGRTLFGDDGLINEAAVRARNCAPMCTVAHHCEASVPTKVPTFLENWAGKSP